MSKLSEIDGLGDEVDDEDDFLPPTCDCSGIMFRCRIMLLPSPFFLRSAANMDKRDQQNINGIVQGNTVRTTKCCFRQPVPPCICRL